MLTVVLKLAEEIKDSGQRAASELPPLLLKAEQFAEDNSQEPLTRALAYRAAGNALQLLNRYAPAVEKYDCAASILESLNDRLELGRTLVAKVGVLFFLSHFAELFECAARARELFERLGDGRRVARLDVNLAHAFHRLDRHTEALECSERALPILREAGDNEGYVSAAVNSAVTLTAMHEFERAEERYRSALQLAHETDMRSMVLLIRYNLAYLRYLAGETAESLRELVTLREEFGHAGDERHVCLCWLDEAEILLAIGVLEEARRATRKARKLARRLGLNSEIGKSLLFEAAALLRLDRENEAAPLLEEATSRFEFDGNGAWTAVSKLQTALLRGERGAEAALREASAARTLLQSGGLPHRQAFADIVIGRIQRARGDLESAIESFRLAIAKARKSRSHWMQFHASYELGVSLAQNHDPQSAELLREAEGMLDSLWNRLGSDDLKIAFMTDRETVYTHLLRSALNESARSAFEISEKGRSRALRERLAGANGTDVAETIRTSLSSEETIVEYFIVGDDLCIFSLNSNGLNCVRRTRVIKHIQAEWSYLDRHFESCSLKWERLSNVHSQLEEAAKDHLYALYRELLEPIAADLRRSLIIVPHGLLHGIPFHALFDGQQFIDENFRVGYSPSAYLYSVPATVRSYAEPLFVAFSGEENGSGILEVEAGAAHFTHARVLVNPSTRELRKAFESPRELIHIAGHAGIDTVGGTFSWIDTAEGRLTSRELMNMHVLARTLVITGCQTARRAILPGDEWFGLMRAFYLWGASAIVSAFWEIRADSASRFAAALYANFDMEDIPGTVQKAAAVLRNWQVHPYFWAGFGTFIRRSQRGGTGSWPIHEAADGGVPKGPQPVGPTLMR